MAWNLFCFVLFSFFGSHSLTMFINCYGLKPILFWFVTILSWVLTHWLFSSLTVEKKFSFLGSLLQIFKSSCISTTDQAHDSHPIFSWSSYLFSLYRSRNRASRASAGRACRRGYSLDSDEFDAESRDSIWPWHSN